jgi:hypothetical protein
MPKYHYQIIYVINPQQFAHVNGISDFVSKISYNNRVKSRETILTMSYAKKKYWQWVVEITK